MAFQDAYTMDIERLRRCSLHAYNDGKLVPFCVQYLTMAQNGEMKHDE
jgi:7,8-dihydro-6-hydroxymethylpterin dimethyltransferase